MAKPRADVQMAELSMFVHGALAALHVLGIVYNVRRGNTVETVAHTAACAFDVWALNKHAQQLADLQPHATD